MPTISDLHAAFTDLEARAPANCDAALRSRMTGAEPSGRVRRRAWLLPVLAGVTVVVVITAVLLVISSQAPGTNRNRAATTSTARPGSSTAAPAAGPKTLSATEYLFGIRPLAGLAATDNVAGLDMQQMTLYSPAEGGIPYATVLVYPAGGFRPTRPADATDVRVNGRPGFAGMIAPNGPGMASVSDGPGLKALAWSYAAGAWAVIQSGGGLPVGTSDRSLLQVAEAVNFTATHPVRVPSKISYLPPGLTVSSISSSAQGPGIATVLTFTSDRATQLGMTVEIDTGPNESFGPATHRGSPIKIGAFTGYYDHACGALYVIGSGVYVAVSSTFQLDANCTPPAGTTLPSLDALTKILNGLTIAAHPTNKSGWINAKDAIPAR